VVVLLAFLVLAVPYFDIFAIFGGTVYPSCFMGLFTTCETGAVAAAPPPRPGVPARPVARRRRYNLYRSRLVGPGAGRASPATGCRAFRRGNNRGEN